ncbi:MAG: M23 family metallopeptidase [Candidatus Treponema excrementipullorum]|nr:M23 family metallopeptidase [Spirochaetia bacterium]MDD7012604.1 M23 family metallopeptidase [Candidatus Treponema excrementipullorum]MDY4708136.1 M23 family metallopeptidase [Candidatus Treponema excrementipullorum]
MARTRQYKKFERSVVFSVGRFFKKIFRGVFHFIANIFKVFDRKLTIMIVPHSQSKPISFRTNVFSMVFGFILVIGIASTFFYFNRQVLGANHEITRLQAENQKNLASLDELRDQNTNLLQTAKRFQTSLSHSLSLLGINQSSDTDSVSTQSSDLSSLFSSNDLATGTAKEAADIQQLTSYLEGAIQPVEQIGKLLESQGTLFSDIPSIWPIKNGLGHISMEFGQNIHPITGQWYIHKGLDFSTYRIGDPIVATANGQVVTIAYDSDFGNYVIIKHKHGIYTRYAHMNSVRVKKGQFVSQGDVIGTIGNTGITTGPHLHYEVHIGSDVVDPAKYINVKQK